jgi:hypothetical protein
MASTTLCTHTARSFVAGVGLVILPPFLKIRRVAGRHCLGLLLCAHLCACAPGDVGCFALRAPSPARHRAVIKPDDIAERVEL